MNRERLFAYCREQYGTEPEYMWTNYPNYAVLRHKDNRKWYAAVMDVPRYKLGGTGSEPVDVVNVKAEPEMIGSLRMEEGILPGYHMNKENWITILLDGSVAPEMIFSLLDISFALTAAKRKK